MDTKEKLQQCFEKLGYHNNFPAKLHINPSTNFIWRQIIDNVKPKKEVDVYKKNIIINRIKNKKNLAQADYPVQEITTYNHLKKVKEDIAKMKTRILEKQNKHMNLKHNNNANYLLINSIKERSDEKRIKIHSMSLKSEEYENEIKQIQELLAKKGISLISNNDSASPSAVYENLRSLVENIERSIIVTRPSDFHKLDYTLSHKSSKKSSKGCFSTLKKNQRMDRDLNRFASCRNLPASRALFTDLPKENKNVTVREDIHSFDTSDDLLPESCFNFEADDEFLLPSKRIHKQKSITSDWNIMTKQRSMFDSDMNFCDKSQLNENNKLKSDYYIQALSNNVIVAKIEEIVNTGNRDIIWNSACSLLKNIELELEQKRAKISFKNDEVCSDDLLPLNFVYIKNNLLSLKSKKQIKILQMIINERKMEIEKKLTGLSDISGNSLELQIDAIKSEASVHFLHREVYNNNNTVDHQLPLKNLKIEIDKLKTALLAVTEEIGKLFEIKEDLMQRMKTCQEDTTVCVRKLTKFLFNPSWADSLSENNNYMEMKIFQDYPMDFIKHFHFVDKDTFYRDSMTDFSLSLLISDDALYEVTSLLQHPQNPPERIITILLRQINKLQVLSSLEFPSIILSNKQNFLDQFKEKETYINKFCENINISIHSSKVRHILNCSSHLRSNMDLWLDMPFRRFISGERLVDDKNYKQYEEVLEYLKKNKSK